MFVPIGIEALGMRGLDARHLIKKLSVGFIQFSGDRGLEDHKAVRVQRRSSLSKKVSARLIKFSDN